MGSEMCIRDRQKLDNQNLQKLLEKRIEVTRSILDLNNTTQ